MYMSVSEQELAQIPARYTNSPRVLFGKILESRLRNPVPEYGFFQTAMTSAIPEFFARVFSYRMRFGFAMTGTVTIPGTPPVVMPVFGAMGSPTGTTACISSFAPPVLTEAQVRRACEDITVGFWGRTFELMADYIVGTTVVLSNPMALGFTHSTQLRTVYPMLPQQWLADGIAFGEKMMKSAVDNHDYFFMLWSEELEKQVRKMTGLISLPAWPVMGGVFSGTITANWTDFNTVV